MIGGKEVDCGKVGKLILSLRKEQGLTQKQLADKMNLSDRTILKWERGLGCHDIPLLHELSEVLEVNIEQILTGNMQRNESDKGHFNCNGRVGYILLQKKTGGFYPKTGR